MPGMVSAASAAARPSACHSLEQRHDQIARAAGGRLRLACYRVSLQALSHCAKPSCAGLPFPAFGQGAELSTVASSLDTRCGCNIIAMSGCKSDSIRVVC
ncbi:hypothetical protein Bphy_1670 [Paraburkholderia phymatum STM815]|uniref:Uncharacterized protein n=1 Tax=Paraburkholderia phymatum (strain DSM 17167 / CIP 108236 / LMG 21445 / STM815) TaxID=391038 RepID=B2JKM5_PARP8|nr:hypothetical protein Bphy_1670 [Paraburkholderia phymatum STM815]